MTHWYKKWFDTKYYHLLYKNRDYLEATNFIDNLLQKIEHTKKTQFLDLACGSGRHAIYLNKKGFIVDGIDLSQKSLEIANKNQSKTLHFKQADMRKFKAHNKYDIILNLFTSMGYFENKKDNLKVFQNIDYSLKKGGYFIIDFFNSEKIITSKNNTYETKKIKNILFQIKKYHNNQHVFKKISITDKENKSIFTEKVQLLTKHDFLSFSKNTNMKLIEIFGNYDLSVFNSNSNRLIMIFKKI